MSLLPEPCSLSQLDACQEEDQVDFSYPPIASPSSQLEPLLDRLREVQEAYLPPVTKETLLEYYVPAQGVASYHVLAVSVLNPRFIRNLLGRYKKDKKIDTFCGIRGRWGARLQPTEGSPDPVTKQTLLEYYIPAKGVASYHVLAVSVLNPKFIRNLLDI